jgi:hexosaminidase
MPSEILLLPKPQILTKRAGTVELPNNKAIFLNVPSPARLFFTAQQAQQFLAEHAGVAWFISGGTVPSDQIGLTITVDAAAIRPQSYVLDIESDGIRIKAGDETGAFYGVQTFGQLIQQYRSILPNLNIEDWPDLRDRGVMLDISRDQVPTMKTLFNMIDLLASWKINQFQLYTEHTFAYRDHPDVWAKSSPITAEEILKLDAYCRQRFIDLVPNQNCFGHMHRWFEHSGYLPLAEAPYGYTRPDGRRSNTPFSLNPTDPNSIMLVSGLFDELLPNFSSKMFNVNCDETFDLGTGRSKALCEERGRGRVYLEFLLEIYQRVQEHGRTMQFWGDIVGHYPELVPELPSNVIALEWGYEAGHPFYEKCQMFAEAGIPFYVCPGCSSWNSIGGRTDNALANIRNAVENGIKYGASGMLNTDWGDGGHWQRHPISYLGWAYGAGTSWAYEQNVAMDLPDVLNAFAFRDKAKRMGRLVYDLGNVYQLPAFPVANSSILFWAFTIPLNMMSHADVNDQVKTLFRRKSGDFSAKLRSTIFAVNKIVASLEEAQMVRSDGDLIKQELEWTAGMLKHGARRWLAILGEEMAGQRDQEAELSDLRGTYAQLWLKRGRPGGLEDSLDRMSGVQSIYPGVSWDELLPGIAGL